MQTVESWNVLSIISHVCEGLWTSSQSNGTTFKNLLSDLDMVLAIAVEKRMDEGNT